MNHRQLAACGKTAAVHLFVFKSSHPHQQPMLPNRGRRSGVLLGANSSSNPLPKENLSSIWVKR